MIPGLEQGSVATSFAQIDGTYLLQSEELKTKIQQWVRWSRYPGWRLSLPL